MTHKRRALLAAAMAVQCLTAFPDDAHAQPVGGATSENAGLRTFEAGKKHYDARDFAAALSSFQASIALLPSPNTRLYIARCQRELGRSASAYVAYNLAVREATDRMNATGEKRFQATKDAAAGEMVAIADKVPRLEIVVPTDVPPNFTVRLDGVVVPREAWGIAVETDPGPHEIVAGGPRRKRFSQRVVLAEGQQQTISIEAERVPHGTLRLEFANKPSGMSVQLNGKAMNVAALDDALEHDVGHHSLVVTAPGHRPFEWRGPVHDAQETTVSIALERDARSTAAPRGGTPKWVPMAIGGAGLVALGVGSVFAVQAKSASDEELAKDPRVRTVEEQDRIKTLSSRANIFFVGGGVLTVGAAVLAFTVDWKPPAADSRATLIPWVGTSGGGVQATRTF